MEDEQALPPAVELIDVLEQPPHSEEDPASTRSTEPPEAPARAPTVEPAPSSGPEVMELSWLLELRVWPER